MNNYVIGTLGLFALIMLIGGVIQLFIKILNHVDKKIERQRKAKVSRTNERRSEGESALRAVAFEDWANKNLARTPTPSCSPNYQALRDIILASKMNDRVKQDLLAGMPGSNAPIKLVDDATKEKARQYATEMVKQLMASPELLKPMDAGALGERAFQRHLREASSFVPNWIEANPHDPLAQRVVAEMLEAQNDTSLSEQARQDKMSSILVRARNELKWQRKVEFAPPLIEPTQPPKRNRLPGGEDPVF
jgi:hypothetical protein